MDLELWALRFVALHAAAMLQQYPTSLWHDYKLLKSNMYDKFTAKWDLLILGIGEKEVLHFYILLYLFLNHILNLPNLTLRFLLLEQLKQIHPSVALYAAELEKSVRNCFL